MKDKIMNTEFFDVKNYITQPVVNEKYESLNTVITDPAKVPDTLAPGAVLTNGTDSDIILGGGSSIQESKSVEYTENGEFTVTPDEGYDAVAQVSVTVDAAGGAGWITVMSDKEYDSIEAAEELNMMDVKGALFSWNASTGKYHVWNADEVKVWDWDLDCSANYNPGEGSSSIPSWDAEVEFPENEYGDVIAVCCGKGLWVSTKWASGTPRKWCESDSPMYAYQFDCGDLSGAEVAKKLYAAGKDLTGSIFATIKEFESIENDGTKGHYFLPSRCEILPVIFGCALENHEAGEYDNHYTYTNAYYNATHIIALTDVCSCSQNINYPDYSYDLNYATILNSSNKSDEYCSAVCLRFGESLVPTV